MAGSVCVTVWYYSIVLLQGLNVKDKVPELLSLLDDCDLDSLLEFFNSNL